MKLSNLATVTTAGSNFVFTYASPDDFATVSADGYFNEARDVLPNSALIFVQSSSGLSFHYVFSALGDAIVATADYLPPLSANASSTEVNRDRAFSVIVSAGNKITRTEIEQAISAEGVDLPEQSVTIFIQDLSNVTKQYLCRYDKTQDAWYQELLKEAM